LFAAIKTILIADLVMSLDNVIGVAAAAKGSVSLLIIGLALSIPLVVFGATILMKLMQRFPVITTIGAGLLGWVAGEMFATDPALVGWITAHIPWHHVEIPVWPGKSVDFSWFQVIGAAFVVVTGKWLAARNEKRKEMVDLAPEETHTKAPH